MTQKIEANQNHNSSNKTLRIKKIVIQFGISLYLLMIAISAYFNLYLSIMFYVDFLPLYAGMISLLFVVFEEKDVVDNWKNNQPDNSYFKNKTKKILISSIKFLIFNVLLLGLLIIGGIKDAINSNQDLGSIKNYIPDITNGLLMIVIMVIGIITVINSIFWLFKRFIKIKNYNIDSKRFDFDKANIILGMMLILIMAIIAYSLDNLFFRTTIGEFFDSSNNFQVLTIKIHYLVIVNIILFSDWKSIRTTEEEIQYSKLSFREIMKWLIIFSVVFFPIFIHLLLLGLRDGFENMLMLLIILSIFLIYAILVLIVLKYEKKNIAEVI